MIFRKTEHAKWSIVYHAGQRIAHFVKGECEVHSTKIAAILTDMGYVPEVPLATEGPNQAQDED